MHLLVLAAQRAGKPRTARECKVGNGWGCDQRDLENRPPPQVHLAESATHNPRGFPEAQALWSGASAEGVVDRAEAGGQEELGREGGPREPFSTSRLVDRLGGPAGLARKKCNWKNELEKGVEKELVTRQQQVP